MKVYVDELPKLCSFCRFYYENSLGAICKLSGIVATGKKTLGEMQSKCQIQSLADHDKQVRKQVYDEIRNKLKENGLLYTWKGEPKYKTMEELLDQIEKGE